MAEPHVHWLWKLPEYVTPQPYEESNNTITTTIEKANKKVHRSCELLKGW